MVLAHCTVQVNIVMACAMHNSLVHGIIIISVIRSGWKRMSSERGKEATHSTANRQAISYAE